MNCQETLNLLYEIIDKEASQIDVKEVQKHLDCCPDCLKKFEVEESLQALVKEKLKVASDIPKIDHLKSKILFQLGQIDVIISQPRPQPVSFRIPAVAWAAAASIVIFLGAAFWGKGLYDHYIQYIPLEKSHWGAAKNVNRYNDPNNTQLALAGVGSDFGFTLVNDLKDMPLIGGRKEQIGGIDVRHFVYSKGDQTVSLFVMAASQMKLPDDLLQTRVTVNGKCFFDHNCRGCRLVYHQEGAALIVTATTDHALELLDFSPATGII